MGDGSLGTPKSFDVGATPRAIAAAHLNRDGRFDVVTTSGVGLSALLNAPSSTPSQTLDLGDASPQGGDVDDNAPRAAELLA